jgi:hypothetical protein
MRSPGFRRAVAGLLLGGSVALAAAPALAADAAHVYRWTDRNGHVHYGDVPSPSAIELNPRRATGSEDTRQAVAPKFDVAECERRRQQLESYRKASTITEANSLGEKRELSAAEQMKLIEHADSLMRAACGETAPDRGGEK